MKKVVYGVGSALLMVVLGLAVFMLFLVVPEREMVVDTVAIASASATTQAGEETEPFVPESHARRNDDTSEEDTSPAEASSAASSFASSSASAERTADNTGAGTGTGRAERDDAGTGATAAQTGRGASDKAVTALSEDGGSSSTTAAAGEADTAADRPNAGNATRERQARQQETQEETQQEPQEREERRTAVVENPTPAPQPAGQTTQLDTGNYNSYLSVSVTDLGNGNYEAKTAPVGGGSFFNAAVTVTVRLTIDVISDVRTVNGIEGTPAGNGQYTHVLTEETRVTLYPDASGYATTGSYWSVDRNDRLTVTGLSVSLAGVSSVSGSVTR